MPPSKKNADKTTPAKKQQKTKTPRIKKEKPKLKTPSVIKVKLPSLKSLLNNSSPSNKPKVSPTKSKMTLKAENAAKRKIELANEVAFAQLVKSPTKIKTPEHVPDPPKKGKMGRRRNKTETENVPSNVIALTEEKMKNAVKKPTSKPVKLVRKKPETATRLNASSKRKADSTSKTPVQSKPKISKSKIPKEMPATPKRTGLRKGKVNILDNVSSTKPQESPSILKQDPENMNVQPEMEIIKTESELSITMSQDKAACQINSRKTSMNSSSECLSWTKDISSSSTTTCVTVCSNDFVRIDKKIPVIKLANIGSELKNSVSSQNIKNNQCSSSDDSDSDSDGKSTKCSSNSSSCSSHRNSISRSLNLSTSSVSPVKSHSTTYTPENNRSCTPQNDASRIGYALDKLSSKLKKLDLEIINWIGYENENTDVNVKTIQDKIFNVLKEESDIIMHCQKLKSIFSDDNEDHNENSFEIKTSDATEFVRPLDVPLTPNVIEKSEEENDFVTNRDKYMMFDQDPLLPPKLSSKSSGDEDIFNPERLKYMSFDKSYNNDDDDALSLFAESITGIESSRYNSSAASISLNPTEFEEYVPQPVNKDHYQSAEKITYCPSKITDDPKEQNHPSPKTKTVCEKQNADSTSIYKESDQEQKQQLIPTETVTEHFVSQDTTANCPINVPPPVITKTKQFLMSSRYKPINAVKSSVFKGVCFFNLISNCKKARCVFPHAPLSVIEVQNRLQRLSEEMFIQEYMLLRNYPVLRQMYGLYYVQECYKRELTRILIEMALDSILKAKVNSKEDTALKIHITEQALMHLNKADLNECDDLLLYNIGQDKLLCDVFMETLAETQNFTRFKVVFLKLTYLMKYKDRTFSFSVANNILERVCILPPEFPLARAALSVIKNTDGSIFANNMMRQFEKLLCLLKNGQNASQCEKLLYEEFLQYKEDVQRREPNINMYCSSPRLAQDDQANMLLQDRDRRYTSPDTTKLDNMNKAVDEPIITRTINLKHLSFNQSFNSNSSNDSEDYGSPNSNFKQWRPNFRFQARPMSRPMRPPLMKRRMDHRQVTYGPSPSKFPRRPGPDLF